MKAETKAHLALITSGILFGANYWIAKGLMPDYLEPMQIILIRSIASLGLFWLAASIQGKQRVERKDHLVLALCGLTGIAINQAFFFIGLNYTSAVDTALIHSASPIMVLLFSAWLIGEKIGSSKITGIAFGAAGSVLLVLQGKSGNGGSHPLLGNFLILLNIISYSIYLVLLKPLMARYDAATIMKWVFLYGFIFVFPFCLPSASSLPISELPLKAWLSMAYIIVGTTFLTYLLTTYSLRTVSAGVAGYYIYMQPVLAALIGVALFNEKLTMVKTMATLLVFAGVFMVNRRSCAKTNA